MTRQAKDVARWKKVVQSFRGLSIAVLADMVADEFVFGEIARVSREAPVLILKHRERTVIPGGGANAAMNLAALGVNVLPIGVVGDDEAGHLLLRIACMKRRSPPAGFISSRDMSPPPRAAFLPACRTTARQQVVRVDRELESLSNETHPVLLNIVKCGAGRCLGVRRILVSPITVMERQHRAC